MDEWEMMDHICTCGIQTLTDEVRELMHSVDGRWETSTRVLLMLASGIGPECNLRPVSKRLMGDSRWKRAHNRIIAALRKLRKAGDVEVRVLSGERYSYRVVRRWPMWRRHTRSSRRRKGRRWKRRRRSRRTCPSTSSAT